MAEDGPEIKAIETAVDTPLTLIVICLVSAIVLLFLVAVTCFCYRRNRRLQNGKRHGPDQPLAFHSHRRPTAVKSPAGTSTSHYLKKSPSPTGPARSPPGMSGHNTPSPTGSMHGALEAGVNGNMGMVEPLPMPPKNVFTTESEIHSPSKEEIETNEKNLEQSASYLGQLVFKLRYKHDKNALIVSVVRCRDLPAKDPNLGSSDPYVKLQLLPDKQHKVKTRVLRKTRNPVYDEDFTFYGINFNQLPAITLHFVVLSFDRYSRDDIIGEVFCALNTVDITQAENQQMALSREIQPRSLKGRGELLVSLCWQPAANRLTVVVLKARNLPKMDVTGLADPYVKIYLLYNGQRIAKKKTHVKKRTLSPVFNESFVFDIPSGGDGLEQVSLEFLLLDWDRVTKNEVIGRLDLGGQKCTGSALHHWNEVCNSPRRQIADWHKLRE
ncbi:PREDICTED: synaptotagmin-11 isoform X2 [Nicrophorus vespilloides]|uniref:Synaptotagmin-11 isoform X2 n=1 Tax=Nicrophorus vespilloides TaxID=110193 RepID=A0ABM1M1F3_NICVS|nr:PREDICTED: synaptotagmin-11 isoform X2 [Nicrophorus vespilloides]